MNQYREDFRSYQREAWWSLPRIVLAIFGVMVVAYGIGFLATGGDLFIYRFWAPKQETARRKVYEQTKSYRQGSVQRLNTLCAQIGDADEGHKPMLNSVVAQEFAEWNTDDVPAYLRPCLTSARR